MNLVKGAFLLLIATRTTDELLVGLLGRGDSGVTLGAVFNLAALGLALASFPYLRRTSIAIPAMIWVPYYVALLVSFVFVSASPEGIRLFLSTLTFPAIFLASFLLLRTREDVADLLLCIILSSLIPSCVFFVQLGLHGLSNRYLVMSTFPHPNELAFYMLSVICATLYYKSFGLRLGVLHVVLNAYLVLLGFILVATQTRSAWLAIAAFGLLYSLVVNRKLLLMLPLVPLVLLIPTVADRVNNVDSTQPVTFEELQSGQVQANSYVWREMVWARGLIDSQNDRVLGKGFGDFAKNARRFFAGGAGGDDSSIGAHSAYVQSLYETGYLGLFSYVWTYVGCAVVIVFALRRSFYLGIIALGFIAANLIINYSDNLPYYLIVNWYIWAFIGADLALRTRILPAAIKAERNLRASGAIGSAF
jgi:O-antigen ligase